MTGLGQACAWRCSWSWPRLVAVQRPRATLWEPACYRTPRVLPVSYHLIFIFIPHADGTVGSEALRSVICGVFCVVSATARFPPSR